MEDPFNEEMIKHIMTKCDNFFYKRIDDNTFELLITPSKSIEKIEIDIKKFLAEN